MRIKDWGIQSRQHPSYLSFEFPGKFQKDFYQKKNLGKKLQEKRVYSGLKKYGSIEHFFEKNLRLWKFSPCYPLTNKDG